VLPAQGLAVEGAEDARELHPVDDGLPHHVARVEDVARPEIAARIRDAVVVEIAGTTSSERLARRRQARTLEEHLRELLDLGLEGEAVADRVDADRGDALPREDARIREDAEAEGGVAVPVDADGEGLRSAV